VLDEIQQSVAQAKPETRTLVQAGPGTGKTEVAAARLVHLVSTGVRPSQILVLSFSRSATRTLMRRVDVLRQGSLEISEELRHLSVRTFDSWTFRMLRRLGMPPGDLLRRNYEQNIAMLIELMRGDRSAEVRELLSPVRHAIVDELQDLGGVRGALVIELLKLLCSEKASTVGFTLLGDEAQGIFGYAVRNGHDEFSDITPAELFRRLRASWQPNLREVVLQKNYRSTDKLATLAGRLRTVLSKPITGSQKLEAMLKVLSGVPEANIPLSAEDLTVLGKESAGILTRTNGEAIRIAQMIWGKGIQAPQVQVDVRTSSQAFRPPAWVGATVGRVQGASVSRSQFSRIYKHLYEGKGNALATALEVPGEEIAWRRLCSVVGVGPDSSTLELAKLRQRLAWPDAFPDDEGPHPGMLHVMTVHQSKGMEFANVAVAEPSEWFTAPKGSKEADPDRDDAEEASVLFVAMTRAGRTIKRIPVGTGFEPLRSGTFGSGRTRWFTWRNGWVNIEMGIPGDIAQGSFVDVALHRSEEAVEKVQTMLAEGALALRGRKVILRKQALPGDERRYVYAIYLQNDAGAEPLLGHTAPQLTEDLLNLLWSRGFGLPSTILNLRVTDVVTAGAVEPPSSAAPAFAASGIWLSVHLYGTGDFRSVRRH
jgi:DNA helicase II / ATP-dependent DNA helicase PcrA